MKNFKAYIREKVGWLAVILCMAAVMAATMLLNEIPLKEIGYGLLLLTFLTMVVIIVCFGRHRAGFQKLEQMKEDIAVAQEYMKTPEYMYEEQYQDCIRAIAQEKNRIQNEMMHRQQDMTEYYSMWVHQIKTPISALKLLMDEDMNTYLDAESEDDAGIRNIRQKQQELFQIEQYVDMALQYTRLGAETNDFVIQKVFLDEVIKSSIHKYARQFIQKKLKLNYEPTDIMAVTDKKWLGLCIDQLLSNAVKYTKTGSITIRTLRIAGDDMQKNSVGIIIEDTGIGISAEDLPRICEKGYTGYNGHADSYSTGIGLYLCREILDRLGHKLLITSEQGKGTRVEIVIKEPEVFL